LVLNFTYLTNFTYFNKLICSLVIISNQEHGLEKGNEEMEVLGAFRDEHGKRGEKHNGCCVSDEVERGEMMEMVEVLKNMVFFV